MTPDEIRDARDKLGLTQKQMARMLRYSDKARVSEIERGIRAPDDARVLLLELYLDGVRPKDWPLQ